MKRLALILAIVVADIATTIIAVLTWWALRTVPRMVRFVFMSVVRGDISLRP